jgi:hypothetical protein
LREEWKVGKLLMRSEGGEEENRLAEKSGMTEKERGHEWGMRG